MTKRINVTSLKKLIKEQVRSVLKEEKEERLLEDSLDQQIDDFFADYESEAKVKKNEGFDFHSMTRRFLTTLNEAEGEEKSDEEKPEEDKEQGEEDKKKLTSEDIDVEEFAGSVVRLIDNYDSLLEVRNTIARRAMNFISKNYDESVVNEFKLVLQDQHDIEVGKSKSEVEDQKFPAPFAARSGGAGGGA